MMKKITFDFSGGKASFPAEAVGRIAKASDTALRLLVILSADESAREDFDSNADRLCETLKCSRSELDMALAFWCGAGIADIDADSSAAPENRDTANEAPAQKGKNEKKSGKLMRAAGVPEYTSEELGVMLENDHSSLLFVDESQRRIGRMLTPREISILIGLKNYLQLEDEYIFILLDHCRSVDKTTIRYVETTAFGLYDEGVTDTEALAENLARREAYASLEGRFKVMIGARGRKLSPKETRFLNRWSVEMKYSFEMIELAYNITVDTQHEYNPAYMNGIMERWYASSIMTPEAVRADAEAHNGKKAGNSAGSFDTDEFLEAALRRSYSDK